MIHNSFGRVAGATVWAIFSARRGVGALRLVILALALLAVAALPLLAGTGTAQAQQTTPVDYDRDNDRLIEVNSLAKLNAIRWDLNGDGKVATGDQSNYDAAFPNAAAGMGCSVADHDGDPSTPHQPECWGYELTASLTFDEDGDGDVDSNDATYWNGGKGWEPIRSGSWITGGFAAIFEGNGNTIDYLFINRATNDQGWTGSSWIGLFGEIEATSTVRSLTLSNVNVTGAYATGALAGSNYGRLSQIHASGEVSGEILTGGIAGQGGCEGVACSNNRIIGLFFKGTVTGRSSTGGLLGKGSMNIYDSNTDATVTGAYRVGGLVGNHSSGSVNRSHASGRVTGEWAVGGLIGYKDKGFISYSYATGNVTGDASGGLVGYNDGTISYSYAKGGVNGGDGGAGGLVGINFYDGVIRVSYASGWVTGTSVGGFADANFGLIQDSYSAGDVKGRHYIGGFLAATYEGQESKAKGYLPRVLRSYSSSSVRVFDANSRIWPVRGGFIATNIYSSNWPWDPPRAVVQHCYYDQGKTFPAHSAGGTGYLGPDLKRPTRYWHLAGQGLPAIYSPWNVDLSEVTGNAVHTSKANLWDFGTPSDYPVLRVDFDGDGRATACEFGGQGRRCPASSSATGATGQREARATNLAPAFLEGEAARRRVMENTVDGTDLGDPVAATDPDGNTLAYSLGTTADDDHFAIDVKSGQIKTKGALDYESTASYTVTVTVTDGNLSDSITVTIKVRKQPEGRSPGSRAASPGADGDQRDTVSRLIRWPAAPEADAETYYRLRRRPDVDGSRTRVIVKVIRDGGERDADERPGHLAYRDSDDALVAGQGYVYGVRTFYGDGSQSKWQRVGTEPPADVNEAPAFSDASIALRVAENTAAGTNIGDPVTATDPDGDTLTYALGGADAAHFALDSATGQLSTKGALDYESAAAYTVTVTATDPDGQSASVTVSITVTDVNEAPSYADNALSLSVAENTAAGTNLGDPVTATDPDGDTLTYALGSTDDDGHFAIDLATGQLQTKGALDYESAAAYTVTVTATDPDGLSASATVSIAVTDVADTPPGQPAPPTFTNIAETSFRILWTAPTPGSSPRDAVGLQYKLTTSSDEAWADVKPAPGTGRRGFNLKNRGGQHVTAGMSYDVRVRERNAQGWGPWSEAGTVTTAGTAHVQPGQPSAPTFTEVQERRFRILWQAPTPGASPITGYDIEYKLSSASDEAWADVKPAPSGVRVAGFNLTNRRGQSIAPGTPYDVRVRARNDAGWGEWSEVGTVTTAGTAPEGS